MNIMQTFQRLIALCGLVIPLAACVGFDGAPSSSPPPEAGRQPAGQSPSGRAADPREAQRLQRLMVSLLRVMDHPRSPNQVRVSIVDDPQINAGSAGSGDFLVTTGLLRRATDEQLQAILAHEIAHDDLGHVSKAQTLGTGLSIATVLLDQLFPGSAQYTPIAGTLLVRAYGRNEEYAADRHGVELLRRANHPNGKEQMINTLAWLQQTSGGGGGGFFSTHPDTGDRIDTLRKMT